ncbi:hypothetical protein DL93DRAFT_1574580 [Clavulina sp. PMI_390]|nr:hypothetical protein DL93DRAFT_1574580 [Clavulina sp. PMI_390]
MTADTALSSGRRSLEVRLLVASCSSVRIVTCCWSCPNKSVPNSSASSSSLSRPVGLVLANATEKSSLGAASLVVEIVGRERRKVVAEMGDFFLEGFGAPVVVAALVEDVEVEACCSCRDDEGGV